MAWIKIQKPLLHRESRRATVKLLEPLLPIRSMTLTPSNRILVTVLAWTAASPLLASVVPSAIAAPNPTMASQPKSAKTASRPNAANKVVPAVYLNETPVTPKALTPAKIPALTAPGSLQSPKSSAAIPIQVPAPDRSANSTPPSSTGLRAEWRQLTASASSANVRPLKLWATYYYVHRAPNTPGGQPLLDVDGNPIGPTLSRKDWCYAAMQGTVQVVNPQGVPVTYNYAGRGSSQQVDCSSFFSSLSDSTLRAVNRSRFSAVSATYGLGTGGYQLVPYRTIAVDRNRIPLGSVIFIPAARGTTITLPSGEQVVHDGYFFAADVGGAIQGNHIDVFIGIADRNPFSFVTSSARGTFQAYVVDDAEISEKLRALHKR